MEKTFLSCVALAFLMLVTSPLLADDPPSTTLTPGSAAPPAIVESFDVGIYNFCKKHNNTNEAVVMCIETQNQAINSYKTYSRTVDVPSFVLQQCVYSYMHVDVMWADFEKVNICVSRSLKASAKSEVSHAF